MPSAEFLTLESDDYATVTGHITIPASELEGDYYIIKRRIKATPNWITLHAYPTPTTAISETFVDYTAAPGEEYQYAVLFVTEGESGKQEGTYHTADITPDTDKLIICTPTEIWGTVLTDGFCNNQRNTAPGVINTLNDKYPTIVDNSVANYETVDVTGEFYPIDENGCAILPEDMDDIRAAMKDIKRFKDFLKNRKTKILKNIDGRMWLCYVSTPPSDNAKDVYYYREISFGITEVADVEDEKELYRSGFITATKEWWSV